MTFYSSDQLIVNNVIAKKNNHFNFNLNYFDGKGKNFSNGSQLSIQTGIRFLNMRAVN